MRAIRYLFGANVVAPIPAAHFNSRYRTSLGASAGSVFMPSTGTRLRRGEQVMATRALPKEHWQSYCDLISKGLAGQRAHIEWPGPPLAVQVPPKGLPRF